MLQITLTHQTLDTEHQDLSPHTKDFLSITPHMVPRETVANMQIQKSSRGNTIQLTLSDRRFENFLFASQKKLRNRETETEKGASQSLFINENLASYNYKMLKKLKQEKRARVPTDLQTSIQCTQAMGKY